MTRYGMIDWHAKEFALEQVRNIELELEITRSPTEMTSVYDPSQGEHALLSDTLDVLDPRYRSSKNTIIEFRRKELLARLTELLQSQEIYQNSKDLLSKETVKSLTALPSTSDSTKGTESTDKLTENLTELLDTLEKTTQSLDKKDTHGVSQLQKIGLAGDLMDEYNQEMAVCNAELQTLPVNVVSEAERRLIGATLAVQVELSRLLLWVAMKSLRKLHPIETEDLVDVVQDIVGLHAFLQDH